MIKLTETVFATTCYCVGLTESARNGRPTGSISLVEVPDSRRLWHFRAGVTPLHLRPEMGSAWLSTPICGEPDCWSVSRTHFTSLVCLLVRKYSAITADRRGTQFKKAVLALFQPTVTLS